MDKPPSFKEEVAGVMRDHLDRLKVHDLQKLGGPRRKLSRKEKQFLATLKVANSIDIHDSLGSSANESDDTIYQFKARTPNPSEFN